ncbi:MAG: CorA family divalent cation transporter [archaeon]
MKVSVWKEGGLVDSSLDQLGVEFNHPTWISIVGPTVEHLGKLADVLKIPRHVLIGRLRSNYPHVDTYPEYTKIFAWYLTPAPSGDEFSFHKSAVAILTNSVSAVTIETSRSNIENRISEEFGNENLANFSVPSRVIYFAAIRLLETYEECAEQFERFAERLEEAIPPWPRDFYTGSFHIRKEASRLLRLLNHFRVLAESLAKGRIHIRFTEEEKRILDTIYDRAIGAEETAEMSLQTVRDLIDMHLDTVSHDMNRAMRLMAAITCIVAIPSVIGALLGMNLIDVPWPWHLWEIALVGISAALFLAIYFYNKGWLAGT